MRVKMNMEFTGLQVERLVKLGIEKGWLVKSLGQPWSELETPSNIGYVLSQLANEHANVTEAPKEEMMVG